MKKLLLILFIFSSIQLFSQEKAQKLDFKFGTGITLFIEDENLCLSFENEINYKLNKYFSNSLSVNYGKNINNINNSYILSYLSGSINMFFSPFKNNKINELKIGTGYTFIKYDESLNIDPEVFVKPEFMISSQTIVKINKLSLLNVIIEYNYLITNKYLVGLNTSVRLNTKQDFIDTGLMLKLGVVL